MQNIYSFVKNNRLAVYAYCFALFFVFIVLAFTSNKYAGFPFVSPLADSLNPLSENELKDGYEVFGFAPYWTINKLDNVDFGVLTTLAYFGYEINPDGSVLDDGGYKAFHSDKATEIFRKAHESGTRVVLTVTQMDNTNIKAFLDDKTAQERAINNTVDAVTARGIDGINIDFEYSGNPEGNYQDKFSIFTRNLTQKMHAKHPEAQVTVSVYASAGKTPQLYDLAQLSKDTDGIFMMAYDFATAGSDQVIPTSPLNGHKEGKYWYDISTAVDDFLKVMPKEKLILGLPWYGYNYPVVSPAIKADKDYGHYAYAYNRWGYRYSYYSARQKAHAQTYSLAKNDIAVEQEGWDDLGQVGWKAYKDSSGQWRMIFLDDEKSLGIKYDFAKQKQLGGVGMWALGFDDGKSEFWSLLNEKFGKKIVDNRIRNRRIYGI